MAKNLVIVESPAKAKTIQKFLGENYEVIASNGHVRDLPKSQLGVDKSNGFEPKYITIRGKGDLVTNLRKEVQKSQRVYLATDPDREGEAISWHLAYCLGLPIDATQRITFNEITREAVKSAIKKPRKIDLALVDAQQARRVLDRLVGYEISPILWKKVKKGLSAGRVQSAALKLLCDREEEIRNFVEEEYWSIEAVFTKPGAKGALNAHLTKMNGEKTSIPDGKTAQTLVERIQQAGPFEVMEIRLGKRTRKPPLPFTTSTLQQEASRRLGFTPQKTMQVAQMLYEGVDIGHGSVGLITYLRTDSVRIAEEAKAAAHAMITETYGANYVGKGVTSQGKGRIQDAHEAIRPTYVANSPEKIEKYLSRDQIRLYKMIYERFMASQMAEAVYDTVQTTMQRNEFEFQSSGARLTFDGYLKIYKDSTEEKEKYEMIDGLNVHDPVIPGKVEGTQHFTQAPPRYSEATLIKALEENGVGRPSTYAPTVATLTGRNYVTRNKKLLYVTELGTVVNQIMIQSFPKIADIHFTAAMENRFDDIEENHTPWRQVITDFYQEFSPLIEKAAKEIEKITVPDEVTDIICEKCGRNMVLKMGRYGKFYACPGFPQCHNTKPFINDAISVPCPLCGGTVRIRHTKTRRVFYGCANYPNCNFVSWDPPVSKPCPKCGAYMVEKKDKKHRIVCSSEHCDYFEEIIEDTSK